MGGLVVSRLVARVGESNGHACRAADLDQGRGLALKTAKSPKAPKKPSDPKPPRGPKEAADV